QALWIPGAPPCVLSTEGGYRSFPISSERDRALADKLGQQLGYPPVLEDVVSGRGLSRLAALLSGGPEVPPETLSAQALKSPGTARDAVFWFIELLARAAADACFSTGARGGVVISGGIVPRFAPLLSDANFRHHFVRPGPLAPYLGQVPVRLVTNTTAALIGAAAAAQLVS
ncbi:MAG: glucokinase, partial [Pseudomonadota bacterium]